MTCCGPPVIGATCDDQITYGETIDLHITYTNEDGSPIDLTSASVEVFSSVPPVIREQASVSIVDAPAGRVRFVIDRDAALSLRRGPANRFRLRAIFGPESDDITPDIILQVT